MKKIVLWVSLLWFLFSFWHGAILSLSPSEWNIPENCTQAFKVNLRMEWWDQALTADLALSSNMEFDRFENGDVFKNATPEYIQWDVVKIMLFNEPWWEFTEWGNVGTVYYKTRNVSDPYVDFVFNSKWDTRDANINIDGRDILSSVIWWIYTISSDMVCENPIVENYNLSDEDDMDIFLKQFEANHRWERFSFFLNKNKRYILWIAWLLIIVVLVSYKAQKKW